MTDDDKRKLIIFTLAHELEHCYQYQIIRHTEGLDNFKMIETHLLNYPNKPKLNMIDEKVLLYELRKQYFSNFSGEDFDKIYSKTSEEGQKAIEWYNAGVYYTDYKSDYNKYKLNPLELDANNRAHQYLTTHYGELDGLVENVLQ